MSLIFSTGRFLALTIFVLIPSFLFLSDLFDLKLKEVFAIADYNFVAAGDWGCTSNTDATVNNMVGKNPERVLGLGDYSYSSTGTCWFNKIAPLDSITKIAIGNHEDTSSEGFSGYMSHFGLSQTYYSYDYENTHLLVMDTDRNSYSSGSSQYNFVINDLQAAAQKSNIDWIIVYLHKFMYTSPSEESAFSTLRNTYHPIFQQYGVDLVVQAHQHNYQRTFPIKYNPNSPSNPTITNTDTTSYSNPEGQIFTIVGTGGQNFDPLTGKSSFVVTQQNDKFGMLDIGITNNGLKLEAKYYSNAGSIMDQFSITKANSAPVANSQTVTVIKNTPKPIILSATDPNNDPLTYSIVTQPLHGTLSPSTPGGPSRTYTPAAGYTGPDSFEFKANDGTVDSNTATVTISGIEPPQGSYNYAPSLVLTGSNFQDTPSSSALQLNQFSVAAWFKTSSNFGADAWIVNKGGFGSDSAGQNLNYGIWMASTEQIVAGFETSSGANQFVASPSTYNDGQWHYAVVTNDGTTLRLYIDGVQVATKSTGSASPESSGTKPVRVGANSRVTPPDGFLTGEVDEVRVWNDDLTAQQAADAFTGNSFNTGEQVLHLPFGGGGGGGYNYAPGLVLTGSNFQDTPSSASLQLSPQFSVAAWFKTSSNFGADAWIVNKGGIGSDSAGQNLNYGIWMASTEQIVAGFETSTGANQFVASPSTYNDGQWHYAVVTKDVSLRLYIDGVQVATISTSGVAPESSGTKPVRVGANSFVTPPGNFFTGELDEVRVWNDDLSATQVAAAFAGTSFNTGDQVLYLDFSSAALSGEYNYDPSLSLSGPG